MGHTIRKAKAHYNEPTAGMPLQSNLLFSLYPKMSESHYWMKKNHFWAREPHYLAHFLSHARFVAMYRTPTTTTFVIAKFTMLQTLECILQKQFAIIA